MRGRFDGKCVLVVGGTSGIGLATVQGFLAEGARVVATGRTADLDPASRPDLETSPRLSVLAWDACESAKWAEVFQRAVDWLGNLHVLVHIAGGSGRSWGDGALHDCPLDAWDKTLHVNLTSVFLSNRSAVRMYLERRQPGVILNVASILPLAPAPQYFDTCAYTVAKGAVLALTRYGAARYARQGIRFLALAPGLVRTPMAQRALGDAEIMRWLHEKQPLTQGPLSPDQVAHVALFLCSDAASALTGTIVPVDAGWTLCEGAHTGSLPAQAGLPE
mgnify:FL=1